MGSGLVVWLRKQSLGRLYHGLGSSPPHLPCSLCRRYMGGNLGGCLFATWDDDLFSLPGNWVRPVLTDLCVASSLQDLEPRLC